MAFITGSASSAADLRTALINACTANGWTNTSNIISKGDAHIKLTAGAQSLIVYGGTGQSGAAITGGPVLPFAVSTAYVPGGIELWASLCGCPNEITFPATYHIHVQESPNEVYCFVNYNVSKWAWLAFGQSPAPGLPGTGVWFSGTGPGFNKVGAIKMGPIAGQADISYGDIYSESALFWSSNSINSFSNSPAPSSFIHHQLDGNNWSISGSGVGALSGFVWAGLPSRAQAITPARPHIERSPSLWNGESVLIPIQPHVYRVDKMVSMVGDIAHARYVRLDTYSPGQVISLGSDSWRIYPWLEKNSSVRDAGGVSENPSLVTHSGTLGIAIRYDGS